MKKLIFSNIILWFIFASLMAQPNTNSEFWKGLLSSSENNSIYAVVNDSIYKIDGGSWINKGFLLSDNLSNLRVDNHTIWAFYPQFIRLSKDEGKNWESLQMPSNVTRANGQIFGEYVYLKNGYTIYRKNITKENSLWEKIYENSYEDFTVTSDGTIYVTLYNFKIIKSKDNGLTWSDTNWSTSIHWSTPGTINSINNKIFVGTYWGGVYMSDDEGSTWVKSAGLPDKKGVSNIFINDDSTIIALVRDQISTTGFYLSDDAGLNFSAINTGLSIWNKQFIDGFAIRNDTMVISADTRGFFISTNKGLTWSEYNNGVNNLKPHDVKRIQMDSNGNIWTLMSTKGLGPRNTWGILKSENNCKTWIEVDSTLYDNYMTFEDLLVTPNGKAIAANYTPGYLNISLDGGVNWNSQNAPEAKSTISVLKSANNDTIFAGTYWDGVLRSIDAGQSWQKLTDGIPDRSGVISLHVNKDTIYAVFSNQSVYDGIYKSADLGNSWEKISSQVLSDIIKCGNSIYGYYQNKIYKSINEGQTWVDFSKNLPANTMVNSVVVFSDSSITTANNIIIAATNSGIFSLNSPESDWKMIADLTGQTLYLDCIHKNLLVSNQTGFFQVSYKSILNRAPIANAGEDKIAVEGTSIMLDGSSSSDIDNDELKYKWTLNSSLLDFETVPLSAEMHINVGVNGLETKSITAKEGSRVWITFMATDEKNHLFTFSDKVLESVFLVFSKSNGPVSINFVAPELGPYEFFVDNIEKGTMIIESILTSPTSPNPIFVAPEVNKDIDYTFSLIVNDGMTNSEADQVVIKVKDKTLSNIALTSGWNIISANVMPVNPDLKTIFQPLIDTGTLKKVMDEAGKTMENFGLIGGGWRNNIGNLNNCKGYKVNVTSACMLDIEGVPVQLPMDIALTTGWNIISYPSITAQDAKALFQSLIDAGKLKKVMDEAGKTMENFGLIGGGWKNNIGNLLPGKGYKVNVTEDCILAVPSSSSQ